MAAAQTFRGPYQIIDNPRAEPTSLNSLYTAVYRTSFRRVQNAVSKKTGHGAANGKDLR